MPLGLHPGVNGYWWQKCKNAGNQYSVHDVQFAMDYMYSVASYSGEYSDAPSWIASSAQLFESRLTLIQD